MKKDMHLLREWYPLEVKKESITESKINHSGKLFLKGVLQRSNTLNQNGRVYPRHILEREVRNYQKLIKENRALGECDHPDTAVVELKKVSHIVREAKMEGDTVYGTIEILDTPCGKIVQNLIESGVTLGISSRGVGSVKSQSGNSVVQEDFQLICFDMVSEPSTPGAFMMTEGIKISRDELKNVFNDSDVINRMFNDVLNWK